MSSLFNTIRATIYTAVFLFTLICLSMSAQFQHVLTASDLTRFVPFSIFVCCASLIILIILLGFSLVFRERNPISTRIELACLGLLGMFWLVLGVFLATSEAQSADVECFSSDSASEPLDDSLASFHTAQYHAMYRVLTAFSLLNALLLIFAFSALLFFALRRQRRGDVHMWHAPVTSCAWFNDYSGGKKQKGRNSQSRHAPLLPVAEKFQSRTGNGGTQPGHSRSRSARQNNPYRDYYTEKPPRHPRRPSTRGLAAEEFDSGGMVNPNTEKTQTRR